MWDKLNLMLRPNDLLSSHTKALYEKKSIFRKKMNLHLDVGYYGALEQSQQKWNDFILLFPYENTSM